MFQFPAFALHSYVFTVQSSDVEGVAPFGNLRVKAY